jgi:hypothetical protein
MIRTATVHAATLSAAPDISRATQYANLNTRVGTALNNLRDGCYKIEIENTVCTGGQCLTRKLKQNTTILGLCPVALTVGIVHKNTPNYLYFFFTYIVLQNLQFVNRKFVNKSKFFEKKEKPPPSTPRWR